jgi:hypothetical protein
MADPGRNPSLSHTVAVSLHPSTTFDVIALAVALALLGGLLAGALASWRIARLRPATALTRGTVSHPHPHRMPGMHLMGLSHAFGASVRE